MKLIYDPSVDALTIRFIEERVECEVIRLNDQVAVDEVEDVRLGAAAVPADRPAPRGLATKSLLALVVGGMIGLFAAVIGDAVATAESGA